jgi:hypothetical protein
MENIFQKGEVVWAKVRGYSWWPGIIRKIILKPNNLNSKEKEIEKEIKFVVKFIGDNSHSILPKEKLENFQEKFSIYSRTKKKHLINSIKLAKKFLSGEISLLEIMNNKKENKNEGEEIKDLTNREKEV